VTAPLATPADGAVCLFLHVPKTAGSTLKNCIYHHYAVPGYGADWFHDGIYYFPYGFHKARRPDFTPEVRTMFARDDLRAVTGHFWFGAHEHVPQPCFYITLLRDPVDRVVSLYHHVRKTEDEQVNEADEQFHERVAAGATLEEFVADLGCREADNDQTRRIAGVEPPFGEVRDETLERAKANLRDRIAFVGTVERFDESLIALKRLLGWERVFYVPALVNAERPPQSALPPETVALIAERNRYDVALYEYGSALLDDRIAAEGPSLQDEVAAFRAENDAYVARTLAARAAAD
jgi:hypothetical protein